MSDRLVLIRHGVTDWNREGRFQGHADPPLAADGRREARLIARRIAADPGIRPARIVTSPLARARETAGFIAEAVGRATELEPRLMEVGQGEWEGRTHAELAVEDSERYAAWRRDGGRRQPPGGEPLAHVLRRVEGAVAEIAAATSEWPVCLVAHGGTLRLLARQVLGLSPRRAWALDLDNASLSVLSRSSTHGGRSWRLERWNDMSHLLGRLATHVDESEGQPLAL